MSVPTPSLPVQPFQRPGRFRDQTSLERLEHALRRVDALEAENRALTVQAVAAQREAMRLLDLLTPGVPMEGPVHAWLVGTAGVPVIAYRRGGRLFLPSGAPIAEESVLRTRVIDGSAT